MALLGSLIGNAMSDNPQSMGDVASNYFNNRLNQDMSQYLGVNANLTPQSTTINYNDQGQPDTVTTKHAVGEPDTSSAMNYNLAPPTAAPGQGIQSLGQVAPGQGVQMPQPMAQPQAQTQPTFNVGGAAPVTEQPTAPVPAPQAQAEAQLPAQLAQSAQAAQAPTPPNIGTPPAPGAPTQLAANGPMPAGAVPNTPSTAPQPNQAPETAPATTAAPTATPEEQAVIEAHNETNPEQRRVKMAQLIATGNEAQKKIAFRLLAEDGEKQRNYEEAVRKVDEMTPNDYSRYMNANKKDGSWVRAILFQRLGFSKQAQDELNKLGYGPKTAGSEMVDGDRYNVIRDQDGNVERAFDSQGNLVGNDVLSKIGAFGMTTKGNVGHAGATRVRDEAGNEWSVVPTTRGSQFFDNSGKSGVPTGRTVPITVGGDVALQRQLAIQRAQVALSGKKGAEAVSVLGDLNKKLQAEGQPTVSYDDIGMNDKGEFVSGRGNAAPSAGAAIGQDLSESLRGKIVSANRSADQQQALWDESVAAGRPGRTAGNLPIAKPGTSAHERGGAIDLPRNLTRDERAELAQKGYYQPEGTDSVHWQRVPGYTPPGAATAPAAGTSIAELTRQREQAAKVGGARSEAFNKILDEEVRSQAQQGDTIVNTRKQQFQIFNRPGINVDKLFGLYNSANENPNDQKLSIIRDIIGGTFKPETEVSQRLAQLDLTPQEKSALAEYNIANQRINSATLRATAGPGSVSDAEQRMNRETNVDPTKIPALGAYNAMAQSQFNGDLARYKGDWAETSPAANALQLDKAWRKEQQNLISMYADIAKKRAEWISKNGGTTSAVRQGYLRYPVPEYDPNTETWIKTKPLADMGR